MKPHTTFISMSLGLLLGFCFASFRASKSNAELRNELATTRGSLDQALQSQKKADIQFSRLKDEAEKLREWSEEVHQLRAEVSRLKREATENKVAQEQASRIMKVEKAEITGEPSSNAKIKGREGAIPIESAPAVVQAALLREIGNSPTNGYLGRADEKNGKVTYGFKGQLADGRWTGMRLAEDGSILEKSTEIPADTVPAHIQSPVAQAFGNMPISGAREIVDGGNVHYELTSKSPEGGMQITVRGDGAILGYSAKFRLPEKEKR